MPEVCDEAWRHRRATSPLRDSITFDGEDLLLGHGTVLCKIGPISSATISLRSDPEHDRMIALLAVAGKGCLSKPALAQLTVAMDEWRSGDRGLAAIRLAFARLPRLRDHRDAYRLFLAETALDAGLSPQKLVEELRYRDCAALIKFDPNQPRVPAGSGAESGRWTSDGEHGPTTGGARRLTPIPVFLPSEPDEKDVPDIEETERHFGLPVPDAEPSGQRLHLPDSPLGVPSGPPSPALGPSTSPTKSPKPAPTPGGPGGTDPTQSKDDKGPACPAPQNDRPNGPNASGDEFEYMMSLLINPNNPTPKYSFATPNVTSQAYYLPSPAPDGKTSFDDCKKDNTPTILNIPDLKPGDMFDMKAPGWAGLLSNQKTRGYQTFKSQVANQSAAVVAEGRGRQVYYCMGDQNAASLAKSAFGGYPNTHFLVCH